MKLGKIEIETPILGPEEWEELAKTEEGQKVQKNLLEANRRLTQYQYYLDFYKKYLEKTNGEKDRTN